MVRSIPLLAVMIVTIPALAADRPRVRPTRDVEVEYRWTGGSSVGAPGAGPMADQAGGAMTIHYKANGDLLRVEGMNGHGYAVVDRAAGRMLIVMTERQAYMEMPRDMMRDPTIFNSLEQPDTTFTRAGSDTVAGKSCTIWQVSANRRNTKLCLTDDGVWLRSEGDDPAHGRKMEAVKITYTEQPADLFAPPTGYQKIEMPAGMPRGAGEPGAGSGGPGMVPGRPQGR